MTSATPLVSIVVATNRARPYLREAIASVAAQTWTDAELIVVDDGSADPEEVALAAGLVPGARVVRLDPSGVSAARNRGASLARGTYLVFLDDDDVWAPTRIERHVAIMQSREGIVASYCGMQTVRADTGEVIAAADQTAIAGRLDVARRTTGIILPNLFLDRSSFVSVGGFDEGLRYAEDLDLALRLAELGEFAFVPETLVDYRATSNNATRRHHELVRGIDDVLRHHRREAAQRDDRALTAALDESLRKNGRFAWWGAGRAAKAALRERRPFVAAGEMLWALRTAPRGLVDGVGRKLARRA